MRNCWYTCAFSVHEWKTVETTKKRGTESSMWFFFFTLESLHHVHHHHKCRGILLMHATLFFNIFQQYDTIFEFITLWRSSVFASLPGSVTFISYCVHLFCAFFSSLALLPVFPFLFHISRRIFRFLMNESKKKTFSSFLAFLHTEY